jgi:KDO2-lipid IV(A) lauroyltransferase
MFDGLLYLVARLLVALLQALPLPVVVRLGRAGGAVAWWLDARHRRVALDNLQRCFGAEKSAGEIRDLARENFRRLGENYASAIKTAAMSGEEIHAVLEMTGTEKFGPALQGEPPPSVIIAVGHFGNFELYARISLFARGYQSATTYRGLRQPSLNRLMQSLRERSGCLYFERRTDAAALREAMRRPGLALGFLADQHAGDHGVRASFLGHDCSASAAPAIFALRYGCPLHTGICLRTGPGRWRVEFGDAIPTQVGGHARPVQEITQDIQRVFEAAVRRDPANWFWVHNRWRFPKN